MIDLFESTARTSPERVFFSFIDEAGAETPYTYRQTRLAAAAVARRLLAEGVPRGGTVALDLPNCPEFLFLLLAAAYGSFTLVPLNHRLSASEKQRRLLELEQAGIQTSCTIDEEQATALMGGTRALFDDDDIVTRICGVKDDAHAIMGAHQDALDDTIHLAERAAHLFDDDACAVIMFTSGTTGRPKAVPLSWRKLIAAADIANRTLSKPGEAFWQAVLPLYHIGGLQVIVRSVVGGTPLRLYERFDAERVLHDAWARRCTHVSVVDKMLQDLLDVEEAAGEGDAAGRLASYQCVLLGGGATNYATLERTLRAHARVYMSYGMTETSSQIANRLITEDFNDGLELMEGYEARIVDPDESGFGRLAVRGPGVFDGYLNAHAAFMVDGFFLTGDTAAFHDDLLFVKERTSDMFVSGGENIYPAEIAAALQQVPDVEDAHVFGVADDQWGHRPVAVVERARGNMRPDEVREQARDKLSKLTMPDKMLLVDSLPRTSVGKIDRAAAEAMFDARLEADRIKLHRIRLPFRTPFKTARQTLTHRSLVLVEVVDHAGRSGLGECVAFETDWYLPETLDEDVRIIRDVLAPALLGQTFSHPREVSAMLTKVPEAAEHPLAQSALEMAFWDLHGHIGGQPLWKLLNEEYERICIADGLQAALERAGLKRTASTRGSQAIVPAGAVIGIEQPKEALETVERAVRSGYRRVKLKVSPRQGVDAARKVREAYPNLIVTLDANRSFAEQDMERLRAVDRLGATWIEEPIDTTRPSFDGSNDAIARLAKLQRRLSTPLCVDESFTNAQEAEHILQFPELRCIAVKIGKFGGIEPALRFVANAQAHGREVWMGGMYETGVSRRVHAAFETLPGIVTPGDIGATKHYFDTDVTKPPYVMSHGYALLNGQGYDSGIGCAIDEEALEDVLVESEVIAG